MVLRDVDHREVMTLGDLPSGFRRAVKEFRAELDGRLEVGQTLREDASADAVAGFDNHDLIAGLGECGRGGEPGGAGANDDYVRIRSWHDWLSGEAGGRAKSTPGASGRRIPGRAV